MPPLPESFVYLHDVDPTIGEALRYAGPENMVGRPLAGYRANRVICTDACAQRLKTVQRILNEQHGLSLVVYDAYRPRKAVEDLYSWSQIREANEKAPMYFPQFAGAKKIELFELSYISKSSNHARGSTVDLTVCELGKQHDIPWDKVLPLQQRVLQEGAEPIPFLDDGTVDMGSSFDLLDIASHPDSASETNHLIPATPYKANRALLQGLMEAQGFVISSREWWHFWLKMDEPFLRDESNPEFGFDFDIE